MFDVQVISASPSQKPIVSPNHCGTSGPSRGTTPLSSNSRPMWICVISVFAALRMSRTSSGVTTRLTLAAAVLREAPHEPFGPAIRARPLRGVAARVVIHLLHEALLILRRQQREIGRDLQDGAVDTTSTVFARWRR